MQVAVAQLADVAAALGQRRGMRDHHERPALVLGKLDEQAGDRIRGRRVERSGRLVREDERRLVDERPYDRDALALATRQLARTVIEPCSQADALEERAGPVS